MVSAPYHFFFTKQKQICKISNFCFTDVLVYHQRKESCSEHCMYLIYMFRYYNNHKTIWYSWKEKSLWIATLTVPVEINLVIIFDGENKPSGWKSSVERVSILNDYWKSAFVKRTAQERPFFSVGNLTKGWLVDTESFRFWWANFRSIL